MFITVYLLSSQMKLIIRTYLCVAFKEQSALKWDNNLKSLVTLKWQSYVTAHIRAKHLEVNASEWSSKFVLALWNNLLRLWQFRNDIFHADNNTKIKQCKMEELNHETAHLHDKHQAPRT
jgi:hypothetical protein